MDDEYIKREDVENLKNKNVPSAYDGEDWTDEKSKTDPIFAYQFGWNTALEAVKRWKNGLRSIPSADVVPVVRCEECKHLVVLNARDLYAHCKRHDIRFEPFGYDTRTNYCSWAERKEND